jgi:hypothetical protein
MNRVVYLSLIALAVVLEACGGSGKEVVPANILPETRFSNVLTDVRLLEGAYSIDNQRIDSSSYTVGFYYDLLFKRYELTREQYLESYAYYAAHPDVMLRIETKVSEKLDSLQQAGVSSKPE